MPPRNDAKRAWGRSPEARTIRHLLCRFAPCCRFASLRGTKQSITAASHPTAASRHCEGRSNPSRRFAPCCRFASLRGTKQSIRPASRLVVASRHCEERSNPSDSLRALLSLRVIASEAKPVMWIGNEKNNTFLLLFSLFSLIFGASKDMKSMKMKVYHIIH